MAFTIKRRRNPRRFQRLHLLDWLRIRFGMLWPSKRPGFPWIKIGLAAVIALDLIAIHARLEAASAMEEAAAQREDAAFAFQLLTDCISGKLRLREDNNSGYGFGKTYTTCQKAEELKV